MTTIIAQSCRAVCLDKIEISSCDFCHRRIVKVMSRYKVMLMARCYEALLKLGAPISATGRRYNIDGKQL